MNKVWWMQFHYYIRMEKGTQKFPFFPFKNVVWHSGDSTSDHRFVASSQLIEEVFDQ